MLTRLCDTAGKPQKKNTCGTEHDAVGLVTCLSAFPEDTVLRVHGKTSRYPEAMGRLILIKGKFDPPHRTDRWREKGTGIAFHIVPDYRTGYVRFNATSIADRDVEFDMGIWSATADLPTGESVILVKEGEMCW